MKKRIVLLTLLATLLGVFSIQANELRPDPPPIFLPNTGDVEFDQFLIRLNTAAVESPDAYLADLSTAFQIPPQKINRLLDEYLMAPADVLLVLQLEKTVGHPWPKILERYRQLRLGGWRNLFISFEIHPGSQNFLLLKNELPQDIIHYVELWPKESKQKKGSKKRKGSKKKVQRGSKLFYAPFFL